MGSHTLVKAYALEDLVGLELSAVCFVRDYVELLFDGPILRCYAGPIVSISSGKTEFPQARAIEDLHSLIGRRVTEATELDEALLVRFADDAAVKIPRRSKVAGAEVADFVPFVDDHLDPAQMMSWENLGM